MKTNIDTSSSMMQLYAHIKETDKAFIPGHGHLSCWITEENSIVVRLPLKATDDNLEFDNQGRQFLTEALFDGAVAKLRGIFINANDMIDYYKSLTEDDFDNFTLIPFWSYIILPRESSLVKYQYLGIDAKDETMKPRMMLFNILSKKIEYRLEEECKYQITESPNESENK